LTASLAVFEACADFPPVALSRPPAAHNQHLHRVLHALSAAAQVATSHGGRYARTSLFGAEKSSRGGSGADVPVAEATPLFTAPAPVSTVLLTAPVACPAPLSAAPVAVPTAFCAVLFAVPALSLVREPSRTPMQVRTRRLLHRASWLLCATSGLRGRLLRRRGWSRGRLGRRFDRRRSRFLYWRGPGWLRWCRRPGRLSAGLDGRWDRLLGTYSCPCLGCIPGRRASL